MCQCCKIEEFLQHRNKKCQWNTAINSMMEQKNLSHFVKPLSFGFVKYFIQNCHLKIQQEEAEEGLGRGNAIPQHPSPSDNTLDRDPSESRQREISAESSPDPAAADSTRESDQTSSVRPKREQPPQPQEAHLRGDAVKLGSQGEHRGKGQQHNKAPSLHNTMPKSQMPYVPNKQPSSTVPKSTADYYPQTANGKSPPVTAVVTKVTSGSPGSSVASSNRSSVRKNRTNVEINNTIKSINEIRHSLMDPAKRTNVSPTTGDFIDHFVRKTDEEISAITADLQCDSEEEENTTWTDAIEEGNLYSGVSGNYDSTGINPDGINSIGKATHGPYLLERTNSTEANHGRQYANRMSTHGFGQSSNNNNISSTMSRTSGHLTGYRGQSQSALQRPISEETELVSIVKNNQRNNSESVIQTSGRLQGSQGNNSQTLSAFIPSSLPRDTIIPNIVHRSAHPPLYVTTRSTQQQQQTRSKERTERQGRHRLSVPQCDSDLKGPVQYSDYSTNNRLQRHYTNDELADKMRGNLATVDMTDVAKKLETAASGRPRRNSLDLKTTAYEGRASPKWVGIGDGYGETRRTGPTSANLGRAAPDNPRGKSSQGPRLSANPTKISLMIARDHQDHSDGPSAGNLSTLTRSARPPLLRNLSTKRK